MVRCRAYAGSQGQVAAQTHACRADAAGAGGQTEEIVDRHARVFIVGLEGLFRAPASASSRKTWSRCEPSLTLVTFHLFPWSVPGTSYARGSGPVKSW